MSGGRPRPRRGRWMRQSWDELDVLRGFAALLMIFNHAGVDWYGDEPSRTTIEGALTYLGSFAPVVFFFLTGLGHGIAPIADGEATHRYGLANKVAILLFADVLLAWQKGHWLGLDFLGFIGLSTLALEKVRGTRRPIALASVLAVAVLGVRFVVGPLAMAGLGPSAGAIAGWLTGARGIDGIAYNPFPWLFYPLAGYVMGRAADRWSDRIRSGDLVTYALLVVGIAGSTAVAEALAAAGRPALRWGVVTTTFFAQSTTMVCASLLAVLLAHRSTWLARALQPLHLRGVSSLAVVPLHYLVLLVLGLALARPPAVAAFVACAGAACVVSLTSARWFASGMSQLARHENRGVAWTGLVLVAAVSGLALLAQNGGGGGVGVSTLVVGQLALCALLVVRKPAPVRAWRPAPRT